MGDTDSTPGWGTKGPLHSKVKCQTVQSRTVSDSPLGAGRHQSVFKLRTALQMQTSTCYLPNGLF